VPVHHHRMPQIALTQRKACGTVAGHETRPPLTG
jgi:hypothetical protein